MKAREIRDLDDDKLIDAIAHARRDVFGLRMQHATGELENTAGLKAARRDVARLLTVARARGIDLSRPLEDEDETPAAPTAPAPEKTETETKTEAAAEAEPAPTA